MSEEQKKENAQEERITEVSRGPAWRPQDADRETYRYETKRRIQHYSVPPQTIFKPAKPVPTIRDESHKRVAVYARVSTKSKEQVSSIENQTKYYTEKIAKTPNWELAEIYSDATVIIGLKQNPTYGRRFSPIFLFIRAFCGAKRKMLL